MRLLARLARGAGVAAIVTAAFVAVPTIADASTPVVGHVYVNDNTAGTNTIGAFDRHADGSLTPLPARPFAAGGAGTGTVIGSQGRSRRRPTAMGARGRRRQQPDLRAWRRAQTARLTPAAGSPVSSGGDRADQHRRARRSGLRGQRGQRHHAAATTPGSRSADDGRLTPLRDSTIPLPPTALPGDILFNGTGKNLIGIEVGTTDPSTFLIDSFMVGADGRLHAGRRLAVPGQAAGPFGSEFSPTDPHQLYVSNAHGGDGQRHRCRRSRVNPNAKVKSISGSPFADDQTAPCWVEISARRAVPVHGEHRQHDDLELPDPGERVAAPVGEHAVQQRARDPAVRRAAGRLAAQHLYVVDAAIASVSGFAVTGGSLKELASSPAALPAGATPFGLAIVGS